MRYRRTSVLKNKIYFISDKRKTSKNLYFQGSGKRGAPDGKERVSNSPTPQSYQGGGHPQSYQGGGHGDHQVEHPKEHSYDVQNNIYLFI